jgi:hypothetical protein
MLMMQRREDSLMDTDHREPATFHDTQLERAVDALKGVMIYAEKTGGPKRASTN